MARSHYFTGQRSTIEYQWHGTYWVKALKSTHTAANWIPLRCTGQCAMANFRWLLFLFRDRLKRRSSIAKVNHCWANQPLLLFVNQVFHLSILLACSVIQRSSPISLPQEKMSIFLISMACHLWCMLWVKWKSKMKIPRLGRACLSITTTVSDVNRRSWSLGRMTLCAGWRWKREDRRLGARINLQNPQNQNTPLHYAILANNREAIRILMEAGARTDVRNADVRCLSRDRRITASTSL